MGSRQYRRLIVPALMMAVVAVACARDSGPSSDPTTPTTGSGFFLAEWRSETCSGAPCLSRISLVSDGAGGAQLFVAGDVESTFPVARDDVKAAYEAVTRAIDSRGSTREGCAAGVPDEWLVSFAGDAGESALIQGCNTEEVEAARQTLRQIAEQYLP